MGAHPGFLSVHSRWSHSHQTAAGAEWHFWNGDRPGGRAAVLQELMHQGSGAIRQPCVTTVTQGGVRLHGLPQHRLACEAFPSACADAMLVVLTRLLQCCLHPSFLSIHLIAPHCTLAPLDSWHHKNLLSFLKFLKFPAQILPFPAPPRPSSKLRAQTGLVV